MTERQLENVGWTVAAVAVAVLLWLLTRTVPAAASPAPVSALAPTLFNFTGGGPNASVSFVIPPVDINFPPLPGPASYGTSCGCACDNSTTINFPDYGNAGAIAAAAAANAEVNWYLNQFGYPVKVTATNKTPVDWTF